MNMTDELATLISKGDVAFLQTSDLGLLRHDSCRYKVWAGVRVGQKVPPCVWDECEFRVNWLHVSQIRPMHWRLNDDFGINQWRRHLTRNIHIAVCVCVELSLPVQRNWQSSGVHSVILFCNHLNEKLLAVFCNIFFKCKYGLPVFFNSYLDHQADFNCLMILWHWIQTLEK